jgi:MFS family permease
VLSVYVVVSFAAITCGQLLLTVAPPEGFELFSLVALLIAVALVPVCLTTAPAPAPLASVKLRIGRLYRISPVGVVGCLIVGLANGAFWTLAPAYVTGSGGTAETVATFMSVAVLGGALSQWPMGRASDLVDRRFVIVAACVVGAAAGVGLAVITPGRDALWALAALALAYGGTALSIYALCVAHANDFIGPGEAVETSSGLLLTFSIGAAIGPFAASWAMSEFGASYLFGYTAALHLVFALFAGYRITRRAAVPPAERDDFVMLDARHSPQMFELDPRGEGTAEPAPGPAAGSAAAAAEAPSGAQRAD